MEIAYLGLFQEVCDWVFSNILGPVVNFISDMLTTVFGWLFENVLAPVLLPVLQDAIGFLIDLCLTLASNQLYLLLSAFLKLIDYLQTAFDTFIGLRDVSYIEGGVTTTGPLLEVLFQQKTINTLFWALTLGGLGIALILTIIATARSAFDIDFENKRPVSRVMSAFFKTFITLFSIPFFTYFILKLSMIILKGIASVMSAGTGDSLSRMIFVIVSMNAAQNDAYNISSDSSVLGGALGTSQDIVRYPFLTGEKQYWNLSEVAEVFKVSEFDYLIGFIICIFMVFTLAICLIIFIQRIFEVLLLYVVSPYFVAMMPLDDGEKFSRWRELFIGKCFSGFGSVIGMRLYLMLAPAVMGNTIQFELGSSEEAAYFLKLFFMAGGAWAVYKMGPMVTSLLSYQAGQSEAMTGNVVGGALFGATAGAAIRHGKMAMSRSAARAGEKMGLKMGAGDGKNEKGEKSQAFRGGKGSGPLPGGGKSSGPLLGGGKGSGPLPGGGKASGALRSSRSPFGIYEKKTVTDGSREKKILGGLYRSSVTGEGGKSRSILGGLYRSSVTGEKGKSRSILGGFFENRYDKNGNITGRSISPLLSVGKGADGHWRMTGLRIPGIGRMESAGADQNLRFSSIHIPGVLRMARSGPESRLRVTDVPIIGSHVRRDENGKLVSRSVLGGAYKSWRDENGGKTYSFMGFENYRAGSVPPAASGLEIRSAGGSDIAGTARSSIQLGSHRGMTVSDGEWARGSDKVGSSIQLGSHRKMAVSDGEQPGSSIEIGSHRRTSPESSRRADGWKSGEIRRPEERSQTFRGTLGKGRGEDKS